MSDIKISLHDGKAIVSKLSSAIADLEIGDTAEALQQLQDLEAFMRGKFVLIEPINLEGGD